MFYGDGGFEFSISQEIMLGKDRQILEHEIRDVVVHDINGDGSLNPWQIVTEAFPGPRYGFDVAQNDGYLYLVGGYDSSGSFDEVLYAQILANGQLGTWTTTTSFSPQRDYHSVEAYDGRLYLMGGNYYVAPTEYRLNTTQYAPFN